jgi:hypothetical protein
MSEGGWFRPGRPAYSAEMKLIAPQHGDIAEQYRHLFANGSLDIEQFSQNAAHIRLSC